MRTSRLGAAIALSLAGATISAPDVARGQDACRPDRIELRGEWGRASFEVEVADTAEARSRGLMFRESLPRGEGMLFVYDEPGSPSFWMRNTLVPLDMLFMSADGVVTRIHREAVPGDETPIPGGDGVQYVLEIAGGLSDVLGLAPGTEARHPAIGPEAAWPCEAPA